MEKTWEQRLKEVRREDHRETSEPEPEPGRGMVTVEELDIRLRAQKEQLILEADRVKHKAVEEARKLTQRQLHKKHLEGMAKQASLSFSIFCWCAALWVCWLQEGTRVCLCFRLKVQ